MSFLGKIVGENLDVRIVEAPDLQVINADRTQLQFERSWNPGNPVDV
jgi:hypothetical protein